MWSINEQIMKTPSLRVGFPKFDMWNETEYRDDDLLVPTQTDLGAFDPLYG